MEKLGHCGDRHDNHHGNRHDNHYDKREQPGAPEGG